MHRCIVRRGGLTVAFPCPGASTARAPRSSDTAARCAARTREPLLQSHAPPRCLQGPSRRGRWYRKNRTATEYSQAKTLPATRNNFIAPQPLQTTPKQTTPCLERSPKCAGVRSGCCGQICSVYADHMSKTRPVAHANQSSCTIITAGSHV